MPPNRSCAEHPHAIVPLPSLAIETPRATGSGLPGLTGTATPSTTSAAAYIGTGLPPVSACVAIDAMLVLPSSTSTVIGHPLPRQIAHVFACRRTRARQTPQLATAAVVSTLQAWVVSTL